MKEVLYDLNEVKDLIERGKTLLLAGNPELLKQLPKGKWIGGSTPYFMGDKGGIKTFDKIYVNILPDDCIEEINCRYYDCNNIKDIYNNSYKNGFSVIIIPTQADIHYSFAKDAPFYENYAVYPLIGWIAGYDLDSERETQSSVFVGTDSVSEQKNKAAVMHVKLIDQKYADVSVLNFFKPDFSNCTLAFDKLDFAAKEVKADGKPCNFIQLINDKNIDTKLPLVADDPTICNNISIKNIDLKQNKVELYAPTLEGVNYRFALPIENYDAEFENLAHEFSSKNPIFSCFCILNYQYAHLENKKFKNVTGPVTFGEIAYQLLNQTAVCLEIKDKDE